MTSSLILIRSTPFDPTPTPTSTPNPSRHTGLLEDAMAVLPLSPLRMHYRSGHPSLIAVSNELFYHQTLVSSPSAYDLLTTDQATPGASDGSGKAGGGGDGSMGWGGNGFVRRVVATGKLESNLDKRSYIEAEITDTVIETVEKVQSTGSFGDVSTGDFGDNGLNVSYSCSPQGFINLAQARNIFADIADYLSTIHRDGRPMSLGVITLNRPQRALIAAFLEAAKDPLGLINLTDKKKSAEASGSTALALSGYVRRPDLGHPDDQVSEIQEPNLNPHLVDPTDVPALVDPRLE